MAVEFEARYKQIDTRVIQETRYSTQEQRVDERKGQRDGERNQPGPDAERHPFAFEIVERGRAVFKQAVADLDSLRVDARNRREKLERDRDDRYEVNRDNRTQERDSELTAVENRYGRSSTDYARAASRHQEYLDEKNRLFSELGRPCRARLPLWAYVAILLAIVLAEVPINQVAFTQIVDNNIGALGIALAIGATVALFSHLAGELLIHARLKPGFRANWTRYAVVCAMTAFLGVVFYFVSLLREFMLQINAQSSASFADLLTQDAGSTLGSLVSTQLSLPGLGLFVVNFLVFGFGVVMSWMAHDPHPDYPSAVRNELKWQKKLDRIRKAYEKQLQAVHDKHDSVIKNMNNQIAQVDEEIQILDQGIGRIDDKLRHHAEQVASYIVLRINRYEAANLAARTEEAPVVFNSHHKGELLAEFLEAAGIAEDDVEDPVRRTGAGIRLAK